MGKTSTLGEKMESDDHEKFRYEGFKLFKKWVFSFKARRKLEPTNLKDEGFKTWVLILLRPGGLKYWKWRNDGGTYLVKTYLEIIGECRKGEDYSHRDQMKTLLKIQLNA